MPLTRAECEQELASRCGKLLALAGLDGTTVDGTNGTMNGPLRAGLAALDLVPAAYAVADADLARVPDAELPRVLDVSEIRALNNALNNLDQPDQQDGSAKQDLGKLSERIEATIARRTEELKVTYTTAATVATSGAIELEA